MGRGKTLNAAEGNEERVSSLKEGTNHETTQINSSGKRGREATSRNRAGERDIVAPPPLPRPGRTARARAFVLRRSRAVGLSRAPFGLRRKTTQSVTERASSGGIAEGPPTDRPRVVLLIKRPNGVTAEEERTETERSCCRWLVVTA